MKTFRESPINSVVARVEVVLPYPPAARNPAKSNGFHGILSPQMYFGTTSSFVLSASVVMAVPVAVSTTVLPLIASSPICTIDIIGSIFSNGTTLCYSNLSPLLPSSLFANVVPFDIFYFAIF